MAPRIVSLTLKRENICRENKMFLREICSGTLAFPHVMDFIFLTQSRDFRFSCDESKVTLITDSYLCSFRAPTSISTMKNGVKGKRKGSRLSIDTWKNSLRGT